MTQTTNKKNLATKLTVTAMLTAVGIILQYIEVSVPIVPAFIKLDFSDLPDLIGTFVLGPVWGVIICLLRNLIHIPFGSSGGIGELQNFILGAVFVLVAGLIYKYRKTRKTAIIGCLCGALAMALVSVITNYYFIYRVYAIMWFGGDMQPIVDMYKILLPWSDTLLKSLIIFNLPFTFAKGVIVSVMAMFIYKPISNMTVRMNSALNRK